MQGCQVYEVEEVEGRQYVSTTARGVAYTMSKAGEEWHVYTRRLALGRWNMGGFKRFDSLAAVATGCKAFADFFAMELAQ
jgi:hypothetical protein